MTFFKSSSIRKNINLLLIAYSESSKVIQLKHFFESGIYKMKEKVKISTDYLHHYNKFTKKHSQYFKDSAKPLPLYGSIQTIFIIYTILISLSIFSRIFLDPFYSNEYKEWKNILKTFIPLFIINSSNFVFL